MYGLLLKAVFPKAFVILWTKQYIWATKGSIVINGLLINHPGCGSSSKEEINIDNFEDLETITNEFLFVNP